MTFTELSYISQWYLSGKTWTYEGVGGNMICLINSFIAEIHGGEFSWFQ